MNAIEVIKSRRSVRSYQAKPIPREILSDLIDCARLSPSGMNEQPWDFVVVTNPETLKKIAKLVTQSPWFVQVPACVLVICRETKHAMVDGAAATQTILLAATAHGLGSCWINGGTAPYAGEICRIVGARADQRLISIVALGYAAEKPVKEKRALDSVLHWEKM